MIPCGPNKQTHKKNKNRTQSSYLDYNFWPRVYTSMYICLEIITKVFTNLSVMNRCAIKGSLSDYLLSDQYHHHPLRRLLPELPEYLPGKCLTVRVSYTKLRRQKGKRGHYSLETILSRCMGRCDSWGLLDKLLTTTLLLPPTEIVGRNSPESFEKRGSFLGHPWEPHDSVLRLGKWAVALPPFAPWAFPKVI